MSERSCTDCGASISRSATRCRSCAIRNRPRKTHCFNGHELTPENSKISREGYRACKLCNALHMRRKRQGKAAKAWRAKVEQARAARPVIVPAPVIKKRVETPEEIGSRELLQAYIAYFQRHHWGKAA